MKMRRSKSKTYSDQLTEVDWNKQPYITMQDFKELPRWKQSWFTNQPLIWRQLDFRLEVLHNCAHPDNARMVALDLIKEAMKEFAA